MNQNKYIAIVRIRDLEAALRDLEAEKEDYTQAERISVERLEIALREVKKLLIN